MVYVAMGAVALLGALLLLYVFANASPTGVRKSLGWVLGVAGLVLLGVLLATGRGLGALWAALMFGPLLWRSIQGWRARRAFTQPGEAASDATTVETPTLLMRLDLGSGAMSGQVRRGRFAGRDLAALDLDQLLELLADCVQDDPESVPLLEAWLDRTEPGWRAGPPPGSGAAAGPMTRAEALAVLGLQEAASTAEIRAAHRRMMQTAHPDRGGSDWLAARLNEARDLLLG